MMPNVSTKKTELIRPRLDEQHFADFTDICKLRGRKIATHAAHVLRYYTYGHLVGLIGGVYQIDVDENPHDTVEVTITLSKTTFNFLQTMASLRQATASINKHL